MLGVAAARMAWRGEPLQELPRPQHEVRVNIDTQHALGVEVAGDRNGELAGVASNVEAVLAAKPLRVCGRRETPPPCECESWGGSLSVGEYR